MIYPTSAVKSSGGLTHAETVQGGIKGYRVEVEEQTPRKITHPIEASTEQLHTAMSHGKQFTLYTHGGGGPNGW